MISQIPRVFTAVAVALLLLGAAKAGDRAPDFKLISMDGKPVTLADARAQDVVVLGLFHICDPCRKQGMELERINQAYSKKGVRVIGVNVAGDSHEAVADFLSSFPAPIGFSFLLDPKRELEDSYAVRMTPAVVIIDRTGTIRFRANAVPAKILEAELAKILG